MRKMARLPRRAFGAASVGVLTALVACSSGSASHSSGDAGIIARDASIDRRPADVGASDHLEDRGMRPPPYDASADTKDDGSRDAAHDARDAASHGVFVAVGYGGRRVRSLDDGSSWIDDVVLEDGGGDDTDNLRTVGAWSGGFVALGWRSMTSPDGDTWTDHGTVIGNWIGSVVFAQGNLVAVGGYGLRSTSPDGIHWTSHSIDTVATHPGDALVYGGGHFVSANDNGVRTVSPDGVTWTDATGAVGTLTTHLAYGNGIFLGIDGTAVVTSADGSTWLGATALPTAMDALVFANGTFTVIADGHVYTSAMGASWVDHPVSGIAANAIAFGDGIYVLVNNGTRQRSTNGINWDPPSATGGQALNWITFAPP